MFKSFKKKPETEEVVETIKTVVTPMPPPEDQTAYMIGKTEQGKTVLRIGASYGYTLTMSDVGVRKLIKLLEAALEDSEDSAAEGHDGRGPG